MFEEPIVNIEKVSCFSKEPEEDRVKVSDFILNPPGYKSIQIGSKAKFANLCSILVSKGILDAQDLLKIVGLEGFYDLEIENEEKEK